ncbi:MAG: hypothetical protein ACKV22_09010 [Bryobacteraceae bacterium]
MLDEFRALVRAGVLRVTADNDVVFVRPSQEWPDPGKPNLKASEEELRNVDRQILDWVKRNRETREENAERPGSSPEGAMPELRHQVVERLAGKILELWETSRERPLQDEVIDRLTAQILSRWTGK